MTTTANRQLGNGNGRNHVNARAFLAGGAVTTALAAPAVQVSKTFVLQGGKLVALADAATDANPGVVQLRGHYTWGAEVEAFQPCGSQQSFWIVGDKALLQALRDKAAQLAQARGKSYQPVYIEASAVSEGKATDGFAMDHDAVYRLETLKTISDTSPAGCKPTT